MGWKNVKEHYQIEHLVQVRNGHICIGSSYCPELIQITLDGTLAKGEDFRNADLTRHLAAFKADPNNLRELVLAPDMFEIAIIVYTYDSGTIILKKCEELGWPNVTHDGEMMYDNTFSADKLTVVKWAKENAAAAIKRRNERLAECRERLIKAEADLIDWCDHRRRLDQDYPDVLIQEKGDDVEDLT